MSKAILSLILTCISASAFAAAVTVNGSLCGSLVELTYQPSGDLAVTTDGACGVVAPPPVVSTPCPAGVDCSKTLPWPVTPQQTLSQAGNSTVAYRIELTGQALTGKLQSAYTSGTAGSREITLSLHPGDFNVPPECRKTGTSSTSHYWSQGPSALASRCILPLSGAAWVNIRHTTCPAGERCGFYLKNY